MPNARLRINCASCWAFLPKTCKPGSVPGPIPTAPPEVAVGIPADLLRRRPDVRRAERQAAAQSAQIGIAEAEFYPHIAINGTIGFSAQNFRNLFQEQALAGNVGPSFTWNILNYGRLVNNVRLQDARFQELVATYQNTVLSAAQDVENGLVTFLRASSVRSHRRPAWPMPRRPWTSCWPNTRKA